MRRHDLATALAVIVATAFGVGTPQEAMGANIRTSSCGIRRWPGHDPIELQSISGSLRPGSARYARYHESIDEWNAVPGMYDMLWERDRCRGACTLDLVDGLSRAGTFYSWMFDGLGGIAWTRTRPGNRCEITEADVGLAREVSALRPDNVRYAPGMNAGAVWVHELGHALGLAHDWEFNMMRQGNAPRVGGSGVPETVLADDAYGARFLYLSGVVAVNFVVSTVRDFPGAEEVGIGPTSRLESGEPIDYPDACPGQTLDAEFRLMNIGSFPGTALHSLVLHDQLFGTEFEVLGGMRLTVPGGSTAAVRVRSVVPPGVEPGRRYKLKVVVMPDGVNESRSFDNEAEFSGGIDVPRSCE